jgi:hypothetical protein
MPRGSRPGERRGGRALGTPNKKTLVKNAVFLAAASDPNRTPLEFMLALMRDPQVPLHLRLDMAAAAAPLVHARPRAPRRERPHPMELRARAAKVALRNVAESAPLGSEQKGSGHGVEEKPPRVDGEKQHGLASARQGLAGDGKAGTQLPAVALAALGNASSTPLDPVDFLLGVMRDPEAAPRQRARAARIAARYKHRPPEAPPQLVEDEFGFKIDPVVARAIRDIAAKCDALAAALEHIWETKAPPAEKIAEYERLLKERDRQIETIAVPETYHWPDLQSDDQRMEDIRALAKSRGKKSQGKLGPDEDAEEVYLIARTEAYRACPRHRAWCRISELEVSRAEGRPLTEGELSELDGLLAEFPAVAKQFAGRNWSHYKFEIRVFSVVPRFSTRPKTPEEMTPDEMERQKRRPEADREWHERWSLHHRQLGAERFRHRDVVKTFSVVPLKGTAPSGENTEEKTQ